MVSSSDRSIPAPQTESNFISKEAWDRISKLGTDLMAREERRAIIEARLNELRRNAVLGRENKGDDEREGIEERENQFQGQTSNARDMQRHAKVAQVVEDYRNRKGQMEALKTALDEKETVVLTLEAEVSSLQQQIKNVQAEHLNPQQSQRELEAMSEENEGFQRELLMKQDEIERSALHLRHRNCQVRDLEKELKLSKRDVAELRIDVDLKEFQHAVCEQYKQQSDRESLEKLSDGIANNESTDSNESSRDTVEFATKKLVAELEALETKHKTFSMETVDKISRLDQECRMHESTILSLRSKLSTLEAHLQEHGENKSTKEDSGTSAPMDSSALVFMNRRTEILERQNAEYSEKVGSLLKELELVKANDGATQKHHCELETAKLRHENKVLLSKVEALHFELGDADSIDKATRLEKYRILEAKLDEYIVAIMSLEDAGRQKDTIVAKLRAELVEQRLEGNISIMPQAEEHQGHNPIESTEEVVVDMNQLKAKLQDTRNALEKKEGTLKYVRARASDKISSLKKKLAQSQQPRESEIDLYFL